MKTKNHAVVTDSGGCFHSIDCDFISLGEGSVMLMEDSRDTESNRTEIIAYFTKPIMVILIQDKAQ